MEFEKITENSSNYRHLEQMSVKELLLNMNKEDQSVPLAIAKVADKIEAVVNLVTDHMLAGGRLFYLGAGTSGRLGIVDASECPPTFGVTSEQVQGFIAGGKEAMFIAQEGAEDSEEIGRQEIYNQKIIRIRLEKILIRFFCSLFF